MSRIKPPFVLFTVICIAFLGLLGLSSRAGPVGARVILNNSPPAGGSLAAFQVAFTPAATISLPIIIVIPTPTPTATPTPIPTPAIINDLIITTLSPEGSDEFIEIRNNGPGVQPMDGWRIFSVVGAQSYNFPPGPFGVTLGVGQQVRIHSGPAGFSNPPDDLLWTTSNIWSNAGDKAELINAQGVVRDSECYGSGCP